MIRGGGCILANNFIDSINGNNITRPPVLSDSSFLYENASENTNPLITLRNFKIKNANRLVIAHLNINSIHSKFEFLTKIIKGNVDILVTTETKIDECFTKQQFNISGYAPAFRLDRNVYGGGVLILIREDIPSKELRTNQRENKLEGIFIEVDIRSRKGSFQAK